MVLRWLDPGRLQWKTSAFDYGDEYITEQVSPLGRAMAARANRKHEFTWGAVLDQSRSLPWIVITFGIGGENRQDAAFCDIWRVPDPIRARFLDLEEKKKLKPKHRVHLLSRARIESVYAAGQTVAWKTCYRDHGVLSRASCRISEELEATAVLMSDFKVCMSIRKFPTDDVPSSKSELSDWSDDIWSYLESLVPTLFYLYGDEYTDIEYGSESEDLI